MNIFICIIGQMILLENWPFFFSFFLLLTNWCVAFCQVNLEPFGAINWTLALNKITDLPAHCDRCLLFVASTRS